MTTVSQLANREREMKAAAETVVFGMFDEGRTVPTVDEATVLEAAGYYGSGQRGGSLLSGHLSRVDRIRRNQRLAGDDAAIAQADADAEAARTAADAAVKKLAARKAELERKIRDEEQKAAAAEQRANDMRSAREILRQNVPDHVRQTYDMARRNLTEELRKPLLAKQSRRGVLERLINSHATSEVVVNYCRDLPYGHPCKAVQQWKVYDHRETGSRREETVRELMGYAIDGWNEHRAELAAEYDEITTWLETADPSTTPRSPSCNGSISTTTSTILGSERWTSSKRPTNGMWLE